MPAEITIRNQAGLVVFDNKSINPSVRTQGVVTTQAATFDVTYTPAVASPTPPLCAVFTESVLGVALTSQTLVNGTWTWSFRLSNVGASVNRTVEYWIFDKPLPNTSGVDLSIFRESDGELMWAMGRWPLRAMFPLAAPSVDGTQTFTYPTGRKYASIVGRPAFKAVWQRSTAPGAPREAQTLVVFVQSVKSLVNGIETSFIQATPNNQAWTLNPDYSLERRLFNSTIMVVDVTNY